MLSRSKRTRRAYASPVGLLGLALLLAQPMPGCILTEQDVRNITGQEVDNQLQSRKVVTESDLPAAVQSELITNGILVVDPITQHIGPSPALKGDQGDPGPAGPAGINCWDTNGNGQADPDEDVNGDGVFDARDCQGGVRDHGQLAGLLDDDHPQYVMEGEPDTITTAMIVDGSVTASKISADGALSGQVLKFIDGQGVVWADDLTGRDGGGTGDITAVIAGQGLTGGAASGDATLHVGAGTGIRVNPDTVSVDTGWADGRYVNEGQGGAITTSMLADRAVTSAKIASGAVTSGKLAANSVDSSKILNNSITASDLAPASVTSSELAAGAVTNGKIANGAVTGSKIATGAVGTSNLANQAVTTSKIAGGAVTPAKISSSGATNGQVIKYIQGQGVVWADDATGGAGGDITAVFAGQGLTGGGSSGDVTLHVGAGTGITVSTNAVSVNTSWADGRYINEGQSNSVTSAMITAGAVHNSHLANGAVTSSKIASGAVTSAKLAANAVDSGKIADNSITSADLAVNSVTASELAANSVGLSELNATGGSAGRFLKHTGSGMVWADPPGGGGSLWSQNGSSIYYEGGNVGIGTSTPAKRLHVVVSSTNDGIWLQDQTNSGHQGGLRPPRNSNKGIALSANGILFLYAYSNSSGAPNIECVDPSDGDWQIVRAEDFLTVSDPVLKDGIRHLSEDELAECLDDVLQMQPAEYYFVTDVGPDGEPGPLCFGLIADEAPERIRSSDGRAISLYAFATTVAAALKYHKLESDRQIEELRDQLEVQQQHIRQLEQRIATLEAALGRLQHQPQGPAQSAELP